MRAATSSGVCIFVGVLLGLGVGDGLGAAVGVGVDTSIFLLGWWVCGFAKATPTQTTKAGRTVANSTLAFMGSKRPQELFSQKSQQPGERHSVAHHRQILPGLEPKPTRGLRVRRASYSAPKAERQSDSNRTNGKGAHFAILYRTSVSERL